MEAHGIFLGRFKENLHFLISYSRLKNKLIEICTKMCTMKYLISCTRMGLIPMWRPMFYFHKTWLIVLLTDARFRRFENSLKVFVLKEVYCLKKKNCIKGKRSGSYTL